MLLVNMKKLLHRAIIDGRNSCRNNNNHNNNNITLSSLGTMGRILVIISVILNSVNASTFYHDRSTTHNNNNNNNYYGQFFSQVQPYMAKELISEYSHFASQVNRALGIPASDFDHDGYGELSLSPLKSSSHYVYESSSSSSSKTGGNANNNASSYDSVQKSPAISNFKSAIGVNNILAVAHENIWTSLTIPGLNEIVRSAPNSLPDMLKHLLKAAEEDYNTKIRTIIFTPTWIKTTLRLSEMRCEVKQAYFEYPKIAMNTINDVVLGRFPSSIHFPPYLQEPLPETTDSFILNMKEQRGVWPGVVSYVGSGVFHDGDEAKEAVEMFEVRGRFNFVENENFILVTVPFKMTHLSVTLILPQYSNSNYKNRKNIDHSELKSMYSSLSNNKDEKSANFRLHLPVKTFISRNKLQIANASRCNETGSDYEIGTCLEFTDTFSYTSFSPSDFQFIILNGGVVNKQGRLLAHIQPGNQNNLERRSSYSGGNFLERWRLYVPERKHLRRNSYPDSGTWKWRFPFINSYTSNSAFRRSHHSNLYTGTERLLIFNQHFNWLVRGSL